MKASFAFNSLKIALATLPFWAASFAQSAAITFTFNKIVDSFEAIPGQPGATFNIPGGTPGAPGNSGTRISFVAVPAYTNKLQLWTATTTGGSLVKLVDTNTAIPGGTGKFIDGYQHRFFGSTVVLLGSNSVTHEAGYYSVSATGGNVIKLVNQSTQKPYG